MWAKAPKPNGTLFSVDVEFWQGMNDYRNGCQGCDWEDCQVSTCGKIELWLTPCGAVGLNFGEYREVSSEDTYNGEWSYFRTHYDQVREVEVGPSRRLSAGTHLHDLTKVSVELNGSPIMSFDYEMLVYPQWNPDFHVGSYKGHMYHFEGFIHSFYYNISPDNGACNFLASSSCASGCNVCPDYDDLYDTSDDE